MIDTQMATDLITMGMLFGTGFSFVFFCCISIYKFISSKTK